MKNVTMINDLPFQNQTNTDYIPKSYGFIHQKHNLPYESGMNNMGDVKNLIQKPSCIDFVEHYETCPLCSKIYKLLYKQDNKIYILIIIIISLILIILIKYILNKR